MTQDSFQLQSRINTNLIKLRHLAEKHTLYSSANYFDGLKLSTIETEMNIIQLENSFHYSELEKVYQSQQEDNTSNSLKDLSEKAYYGDQEALQQLINIAQKNPEAGGLAKQILCDLAENGDQSTAKTLLDSFGKDGSILAALVKGNSSYAGDAATKIAEIMDIPSSNNSINGQNSTIEWTSKLEELVLDKLCDDPESNIHLIAKFANKERGAQALYNIAVEKPTTYAGGLAARALGKSFVSGNSKVAQIALKGLIAAGCNGNIEAVSTLTGIATSNAVSTKKAVQAMDALAEIASTSSQSGSENTNSALGALINIAQNQRVSPKMRAYAINHLGKLIQQGADQGMNATEALIGLAKSSSSTQVAEAARDNIFAAAESNPKVLDKGVDLFIEVAKDNIPANNKVKMHAVDLLGKAVQNNGQNSEKALNSLVELTQNHNKTVSRRAKDNLKTLGIESKSNQDISINPEDNKEEQKNQQNDLNFIS